MGVDDVGLRELGFSGFLLVADDLSPFRQKVPRHSGTLHTNTAYKRDRTNGCIQ